jgi:two-component system chemotaxis sensor kinase CheA
MQEAINIFIEESHELLAEMEAALLELEKDQENTELINGLFRYVHTIKGSAGIFGYDEIVSFTHVGESVLDRIRNGELHFNEDIIHLLLSARDLIGTMVDVSTSETEFEQVTLDSVEKTQASLQKYLDQIEPEKSTPNEPEVQQSEDINAQNSVKGIASDLWHLSLRFNVDVLEAGMDPGSFIRYLSTIGEVINVSIVDDALPDLDSIEATQCYLGFEVSYASEATKETIESVFEFVQDDADINIISPHSKISEYIDRIQSLPESDQRLGVMLVESGAITQVELEQGLKAQSLSHENHQKTLLDEVSINSGTADKTLIDAVLKKEKDTPANAKNSIRVDADKLDSLINLVGEMVIAGAGANLLANTIGNEPLTESMSVLGRLVEEIRDNALRLRMVQIGETFKRFKRVVRDVSKELKKEVELVIEGGETELDKTFIEKIGDPLMHLVRNSLDHGVEPAEQRLAKGKPSQGSVKLNAYHESGSIVIQVSDDGQGLDKDKILAKAHEKGLISEGKEPKESDILRLIFEPGFSTAAEVTNLSGRGVGMDVVRKNIEQLKGTIDLASEAGVGTQFTIRLPLTLAIIDGFLVSVDGATYVIPLDMVVECIELNDDTSKSISSDNEFIELRGHVLPLIRLRKIMKAKELNSNREAVVVVQFARQKVGFVVDELLGEYQTVIKSLGKLFDHERCIGGATILGSGEVAIILDVPGLIDLTMKDQEVHNIIKKVS